MVIEAMEMEHRLSAERGGVVEAVLVSVGDQVDAHELLVRVAGESGGT